jgi:tungstate transport system substrate-binding protein
MMPVRLSRRAVLCALILLLGCRSSPATLVLATTTSVVNSGLLDRVLPAYASQPVRALQVGSGRALIMLESNGADVVISHAPEREGKALQGHPGWFYRKILYNDFLVVGPPGDPARIAGLTDAVTAMKRIIESHQRFLSRGDESGTHERERQLWAAAGVAPKPDQVIVAGAGMGQTLRIASATGAYTLTDRGTFEMLSPSLRLRVVVAGDPALLNTYAVVAAPSNDRGLRFARWLAEGEGRRVLADTLQSGQVRGFTLWPPDRDGTRPDSRPF